MIVTRIWGKKTGAYFCISSKSASGKWRDHFFERGDFKDIPAFLNDHRDRDLYFCPHGFIEPQRLKKHAITPRVLWSDMDAADPRLLKIKPTIAIESSPGRYVGIWVLKGEWPKNMPEQERRIKLQSANRRLSHMIGGDPTGWDFTQVLRIPGTLNYKYSTTPRVRLLWTEGPWYTLEEIEAQLPEETPTEDVTIEGDSAKVYKTWHKKMPHWMRRELTRRTIPERGNRSEMMFKLAATCVELGMDREETLLMLQMTPWNKYAGRNDEGRRLQDLWDRAINKKGQASRVVAGEDEDDDRPKKLLSRSMAEIEERDIEWVWYGFLAKGEVTLLSGDPEAGKSFVAQNIAGAICKGEPLPSHIEDAPPPVRGKVAYFDIENSPETVTKKRLRWSDFGLDAQANFYQEEYPFSITDEEMLECLYEALERVKPVLVVFDTLNTYIGRTDTHNGAESQQSFIKFKEIAERFNCSVLVLRHLTKGSRDKALYRGSGSIAFTGLARIEIMAGHHPEEDGMRLLAQAKNNLVAKPPALTYEIAAAGSKKERDRAIFDWGEFDERLNAEHVVSAPSEKDPKERETAKELIREQLADGPREKPQLLQLAEARSISERTLYRAMREMNIVSTWRGKGKDRVALWSLPESSAVAQDRKRR